MRRLLGLAIIAGLSFCTSSFAADTKSTDTPSDSEKKPDKKNNKKSSFRWRRLIGSVGESTCRA